MCDHGVLFLEELPEFGRDMLDAPRQLHDEGLDRCHGPPRPAIEERMAFLCEAVAPIAYAAGLDGIDGARETGHTVSDCPLAPTAQDA